MYSVAEWRIKYACNAHKQICLWLRCSVHTFPGCVAPGHVLVSILGIDTQFHKRILKFQNRPATKKQTELHDLRLRIPDNLTMKLKTISHNYKNIHNMYSIENLFNLMFQERDLRGRQSQTSPSGRKHRTQSHGHFLAADSIATSMWKNIHWNPWIKKMCCVPNIYQTTYDIYVTNMFYNHILHYFAIHHIFWTILFNASLVSLSIFKFALTALAICVLYI